MNTRIVDTMLVFFAFVGIILMITIPPAGWAMFGVIILAFAFGGDA